MSPDSARVGLSLEVGASLLQMHGGLGERKKRQLHPRQFTYLLCLHQNEAWLIPHRYPESQTQDTHGARLNTELT